MLRGYCSCSQLVSHLLVFTSVALMAGAMLVTEIPAGDVIDGAWPSINDEPSSSGLSRDLIPERMFRLYDRKQAGLLSDRATFRTYFSLGAPDTSELISQHGRHVTRWSMCVVFNVSDIPKTETTNRAELYVSDLVDDVSTSSSYVDHVMVYQIIRPPSEADEGCSMRFADMRLLDDITVDHSNATRSEVVMTVTSAMTSWRRKPASNHGLVVQWSRRSGSKARRSSVTLPSRPYMMTYGEQLVTSSFEPDISGVVRRQQRQQQQHGKRYKRDIGERRVKSPGGAALCRRKPLYVDFADIGWNSWIVAPAGYQAFYCGGDCPFYMPDSVNPSNHAIIQSKIHSIDVNAVPKPCCVPTKLSSISILQTNAKNNAVILKSYSGMVVQECGCR